MKKLLSLLAVLVICAICTLPVAAKDKTRMTVAAEQTAVEEEYSDELVDEKDYVIDLRVATAVIVTVSAVLILGIGATTVVLARRNRS